MPATAFTGANDSGQAGTIGAPAQDTIELITFLLAMAAVWQLVEVWPHRRGTAWAGGLFIRFERPSTVLTEDAWQQACHSRLFAEALLSGARLTAEQADRGKAEIAKFYCPIPNPANEPSVVGSILGRSEGEKSHDTSRLLKTTGRSRDKLKCESPLKFRTECRKQLISRK